MIWKIEFREEWDLPFVEWFSGKPVPKSKSSSGLNVDCWCVWLVVIGRSPFVWTGSSRIFNKSTWKYN